MRRIAVLPGHRLGNSIRVSPRPRRCRGGPKRGLSSRLAVSPRSLLAALERGTKFRVAVLLSVSWLLCAAAQAQDKKGGRNARDHAPAAPKTEAADKPDAEAAAQEAAQAEDASQVRTEGDTQVKVMEFSGLDIEGQLKTPQMLYFLNRLRAEFGRPRLPHRSFMPELQRSTKEKSF